MIYSVKIIIDNSDYEPGAYGLLDYTVREFEVIAYSAHQAYKLAGDELRDMAGRAFPTIIRKAIIEVKTERGDLPSYIVQFHSNGDLREIRAASNYIPAIAWGLGG